MRRLLPVACLAPLLLASSGCGRQVDPDQARLCRTAVMADVDDPASVTVERQSQMAPLADQAGIAVDYRIATPDHRVEAHRATCRFAVTGMPARPADLVSFARDGDEIDEVALFFLQRFWLDTAEAQGADPEPVPNASRALRVSPGLAHGLQGIINALPAMATYAMLSAAYSLVYGLVGRINLAFGQMAGVGAAASLTAIAFVTHPTALLLLGIGSLAALWATTTHGAVIARLVFRPLSQATGQQGLVATIGLALVLTEYVRLTQGSAPLWIPPIQRAPVAIARSEGFTVTVTPLALTLTGLFFAVALAVLLLMARTQFGRNWRALADDARAAALLGIDPNRVFAQTFALASALAGAAGTMVVLVYGSFGGSYANVLGLKGLLAAVLGGIGSVPGAFLGGVAISAIEALWSAYFPIEYRDLALFSLLVCILVGRPGGIFGFRDLRPRSV